MYIYLYIYRGAYMEGYAYSLVIGRKSSLDTHIHLLSDGNRGSSKNPKNSKEGRTIAILRGNPKKGTAVKN